MFAKQLLISFIYELVQIFYFSDQIVQKFYQKYLIEKVYIYHVLTDTESVCLKFVFVISSTDSDIPAEKFRDIIFGLLLPVKFAINLVLLTFIENNLEKRIKKSAQDTLKFNTLITKICYGGSKSKRILRAV